MTWNGREKQNYTYDGLGRLTNKKIICHSEPVEASQQTVLNNQYTYEDVANSNKTTTLVKSVTNAVGTCTYTYDLVGNIKTISDGTYTTSYDYDALNQLVRENNQKENYTKTFEYSNGNITSKKTYVYTLGTLSGTPTVETFAYGDAEWKDLLTSFNGKNITYDAIGNPTKIGTDVLSWQGRQLMSYGTNSYEYNADGQRTSKTVGGVKTEFFYNGSILAGQKCGNDTLIFMYDNNGDSFGFTYNGTEYYYVKNAQNDVIAVANANGTIVAKYTYDAWGKTISITDANGNIAPQNSIGNINPIRYRSYYFDAETNLYHLNTRYYSPIMCRFLNADGIVGANQDVLGYNLFAYCSNDPVNNCDTTGQGKISNWFKQAVKTVKNWWNGTSNNANHNIIPSSNQIVGVVADSVLGSTINTLNTKTKSQQYGLNSKGTVRGTPWATQPKYPKSTKVANKMSSVVSVATLSFDIGNTWTAYNSNTNGDRILKTIVQVTGAAAGVLVGAAAAAAFSACVAVPVAAIGASVGITLVGAKLIDFSTRKYYETVGIE